MTRESTSPPLWLGMGHIESFNSFFKRIISYLTIFLIFIKLKFLFKHGGAWPRKQKNAKRHEHEARLKPHRHPDTKCVDTPLKGIVTIESQTQRHVQTTKLSTTKLASVRTCWKRTST